MGIGLGLANNLMQSALNFKSYKSNLVERKKSALRSWRSADGDFLLLIWGQAELYV